MHQLKRFFLHPPKLSSSSSLAPQIKTIPFSTKTNKFTPSSARTKGAAAATTGDDEWNDAWESVWLPNDALESSDITLPSAADATAAVAASSEIDADTKAFVAEMDERWNERRGAKKSASPSTTSPPSNQKSKKKDADEYRVRKQRIHAGLWMKEIEKMEESRVGGDPTAYAAGDDIDRLLDSAAEWVVIILGFSLLISFSFFPYIIMFVYGSFSGCRLEVISWSTLKIFIQKHKLH